MKFIKCILLFLMILTLAACEKFPGEGGTSSISGKILFKEYESLTAVKDSFYLAEERVYIIYGNESKTHDDEMRSSYDGSFVFEDLRKGKYQIFVYTECTPSEILTTETCPSGEKPIIVEVEIDKNGEDIVLDDLIVEDYPL